MELQGFKVAEKVEAAVKDLMQAPISAVKLRTVKQKLVSDLDAELPAKVINRRRKCKVEYRGHTVEVMAHVLVHNTK